MTKTQHIVNFKTDFTPSRELVLRLRQKKSVLTLSHPEEVLELLITSHDLPETRQTLTQHVQKLLNS